MRKIDFYYFFPFTVFDLKKVTDYSAKVTGRKGNERTILQTYLERFPPGKAMPAYNPGLISNNMSLERNYKFRAEMWVSDWDHIDLLKRLNYEKDVARLTANHKATELHEHFAHQRRETIKEFDRTQRFITNAAFDRFAYRAFQYRNSLERTAAMENVRECRVDATEESKRLTQLAMFRQHNLTDGGIPNAMSYNAGDAQEELMWIKINSIPSRPLAMEQIGELLAASGLQATQYLNQTQANINLANEHLSAKSEGHALRGIAAAKKKVV